MRRSRSATIRPTGIAPPPIALLTVITGIAASSQVDVWREPRLGPRVAASDGGAAHKPGATAGVLIGQQAHSHRVVPLSVLEVGLPEVTFEDESNVFA